MNDGDVPLPPTRPHRVDGLEFQARLMPRGGDTADAAVVDEVVGQDCYGLRLLADVVRARPGGDRPVLFDVGGNIGAFGALFLSTFPGGRLVAFEPHPENRRMYQRHLADNGLAGEVEPCAVKYTGLEDLRLVTFPGHEGLTSVMSAPEVAAMPAAERRRVMDVPVRTATLEKAAAERGIERIHVCKMDCEYGEWDIFEHADPAFWPRVDFVAGEFHGSARKFGKLLAKVFPDRARTVVATYPILGQFWVGPADGADARGPLLEVERAFWRHIYAGARAEAKSWRDRYARLVTRFPMGPVYRLVNRLRGVETFHQFEDGPLDLRPDDDE